ncbi:hypothetical protein [Hymenobacter jeollabukensis]|uniref:Uncharacterized protein n=1 Tax=Hymenobacter jeollabukensis TaxID=2025313 RepID=A0A5R8WID5_9BACT|nr:hypothetical protein [Hymenobacter jeollabukensis]TLM88394.1 hypothetical protein FDY95_24765 [Hymenobacter jeollabukensis]
MHPDTPEKAPDAQRPQSAADTRPDQSEGTSQSMLDRETYGQILDQPAPDADTSDLTSALNQPASQHLGNEERVPGEENPNARAD